VGGEAGGDCRVMGWREGWYLGGQGVREAVQGLGYGGGVGRGTSYV